LAAEGLPDDVLRASRVGRGLLQRRAAAALSKTLFGDVTLRGLAEPGARTGGARVATKGPGPPAPRLGPFQRLCRRRLLAWQAWAAKQRYREEHRVELLVGRAFGRWAAAAELGVRRRLLDAQRARTRRLVAETVAARQWAALQLQRLFQGAVAKKRVDGMREELHAAKLLQNAQRRSLPGGPLERKREKQKHPPTIKGHLLFPVAMNFCPFSFGSNVILFFEYVRACWRHRCVLNLCRKKQKMSYPQIHI
jgi:hypothetical protein